MERHRVGVRSNGVNGELFSAIGGRVLILLIHGIVQRRTLSVVDSRNNLTTYSLLPK